MHQSNQSIWTCLIDYQSGVDTRRDSTCDRLDCVLKSASIPVCLIYFFLCSYILCIMLFFIILWIVELNKEKEKRKTACYDNRSTRAPSLSNKMWTAPFDNSFFLLDSIAQCYFNERASLTFYGLLLRCSTKSNGFDFLSNVHTKWNIFRSSVLRLIR